MEATGLTTELANELADHIGETPCVLTTRVIFGKTLRVVAHVRAENDAVVSVEVKSKNDAMGEATWFAYNASPDYLGNLLVALFLVPNGRCS